MSDNEVKLEEVNEEVTSEVSPEVVEESTPVETVDVVLNDAVPPVIEITKKVGTARLIYNNATTVYRFDIHFNSQYNSLEYKNVVNGFSELNPKGTKGIKDFFAMYGIMYWNFPKTILAINSTEYLESMTKIENLLNQHIKSAGLKKFVFRVETV